MKILIWKIGSLGDVLMTTPLVRQLRARHPHAQLHYLVGRVSAGVLRGNPHLDELVEFDEQILHGGQAWLIGKVLPLLRGYDCAYILDKHWVFGWLARAAGIPQRIGFWRRSIEGWPHTRHIHYDAVRHEIDYYLDLQEAAGLPVDRNDRSLQLPQAETLELPQPYVVAINSGGNNPGEASDVRKLPAPLFAALVNALAQRTRVVFLGSQGERRAYQELAERHGASNLCGNTSLRQAWGVLAQAQSVYTTDSGLMHMAAAVNGQVVGIFGPTHPGRKCPPGARPVWRDQDQYDSRYELFGRLPRRRFFRCMTVSDILEA